MNDDILREGERIDDLELKGLRIIQSRKGFRFGMDAVLLAHFVDVRPGDRVADLGTGTGIIPLLLAGHTKASKLTGLEIQPEMADMAGRSVALNNLTDRVSILQGDLRQAHELLGYGGFDVVTCNPPYERQGSGVVSEDRALAIARRRQDAWPWCVAAVLTVALARMAKGDHWPLDVAAGAVVGAGAELTSHAALRLLGVPEDWQEERT